MTDTENHITDGFLPPEPVIDWEARSQKMFSENIRQAERYKGKIREQGERIQELERISATLCADVSRMQPAHEKRQAAELALEETQKRWAERLNEASDTIRELRRQVLGGERVALESAIAFLNERAKRLPPLPKEAMPAGGLAP